MFDLNVFVMETIDSMIGNEPEYKVRQYCLGWFEKNVLTEADLAKPARELNDDDLDTVAGGGDVSCACAMGGGGTKDSNDKTCACVLAGVGYDVNKSERCLCGFAGYGYDS